MSSKLASRSRVRVPHHRPRGRERTASRGGARGQARPEQPGAAGGQPSPGGPRAGRDAPPPRARTAAAEGRRQPPRASRSPPWSQVHEALSCSSRAGPMRGLVEFLDGAEPTVGLPKIASAAGTGTMPAERRALIVAEFRPTFPPARRGRSRPARRAPRAETSTCGRRRRAARFTSSAQPSASPLLLRDRADAATVVELERPGGYGARE